MKKKVLIIAGGTGGHIFPALTIADHLVQKNIDIHWLGSKIGLEKNLVVNHYPITYIAAKRLRGKGWRTYLLAPFQLLITIYQAWRAIHKIKPDLILAMGGFVSGPGGIAAKLAGKDLIIHEQNSVAGYSNKLLSHWADVIMTAYPNVFPAWKRPKVIGNPVRESIANLTVNREENLNVIRILVLGGSQGAHGLNQCILNFIKYFPQRHLQWWHQTGKHDYPEVLEAYTNLNVMAQVEPFIDRIVEAYQWADLVICRAGALTLAEITCAGLPSILVPFPAAVDDHQWYNGYYLQEVNAAILIREKELTPERLGLLIDPFLNNRSLLAAMAERSRELAKPEAAIEATQIILNQLSKME